MDATQAWVGSVELLTEDRYRALQRLGEVHSLGGDLFCDRRYGKVFVYHNGAQPYYAARGFRAQVMTIQAPSVYVRHTGTAKGRGAYAARAYAAGELIEACPVILFCGTFSAVPEEVRKLLFNWGALAEVPHTHCLALGYGSLYNHQNPSNMRYEAHAASRVLRFIAIRDIGIDEELTINYNAVGGGHESEHDTWFNGMGVEPVK